MPFIDELSTQRQAAISAAQAILTTAAAENRTRLSASESRRFEEHRSAAERISARLEELGDDMERGSAIDDRLAQLRGGGGGREVRSAGMVPPLGYSDETLRRAHATLAAGGTVKLEARAFNSAVGLLPAELYPVPTFPRHEARLLDRLPGFALDAPSLEYVQVTSVSGAAQVVAEGTLKPEITFPPTKQIITALKLACHGGISWENIADYDAFTAAVQGELLKSVIDLENSQLVYGTGGTTELSGLTSASGILTLAATGSTATPPNSFDDIAGAIALLRTGPALASPDLVLLHPDTWANIRTQKDTLGRYISGNDPTDDQPETAWGVEVLQSTAFHPGEAVLLDTQLFGRVAVRAPDPAGRLRRGVRPERLPVQHPSMDRGRKAQPRGGAPGGDLPHHRAAHRGADHQQQQDSSGEEMTVAPRAAGPFVGGRLGSAQNPARPS